MASVLSRTSFDRTNLLKAALLSAVLLAGLPVNVLGITFGPVIDLSVDTESSIDHRMAVDGGNVFVVWDNDSTTPSSITMEVSTDGGVSFIGAETVSNEIDYSSGPQVAAIGNTTYVVWVNEGDPLSGDFGDISFRKGTISGGTLTFDDEQNISNTTDSSLNPRIAVSDGNVFILWEEDVGGYNDIFYAASSNDGDDFVVNNLSNSTGIISENAQLVASGNDAFITWNDLDSDITGISDAFFIKGTISGSSISFSGLTNLSTNLSSFAFAPKIAKSGSNVHILWDDLNLLDVFFATSIDGGSNFDIPADSTDNNVSNNGNSANPAVAALDDDVHILWVNNNEGNGDVFYNKGTVIGNTLNFMGEINIDGEPQSASLPSISVSGTNVYVTWETVDFPSEIFVSVSTDGGSSSGTVNLSNNAGVSTSSRVVSSADKGYVAWQDDVSGDYDILIRTIEETGLPSISIESVSDTTPTWDLDSVVISGFVNGNATDTISIDWDDGNVTSGIAVSGTTWGPYAHFYNSTNIGPKQIVVTLLNATAFEIISDTEDITVQKHETSLTIGPIFSVVEATDITVTGVLTDTDKSVPIAGANITFDGSGAGGLPTTVTLADGTYNNTGASPGLVDELLTVQAHFAGDSAYGASNSSIEGYDTVAVDTTEFAVSAGSPSGPIDLTGFNASIIFDNISSAGSIFVSDCESPVSARYEPMTTDHCIKISPAVELDLEFSANLTVTFDENNIPDGFAADEIDIFHEGLDGITDIASARNEDTSTITGTITEFSKFIVGAAIHDDAPAGAERQQIFVGDNNLLFNFTTTKEIMLDGSQYSVGEIVTLQVTDPSRNLDDDTQDTIEATVNSTSDQTGITLDLLETGADTSIFEGTFTLTSGSSSTAAAKLHVEEGDDIQAVYEEYTKAPFRVLVENVTEAGLAQVIDFSATGHQNLNPVGDGYELSLIDSNIEDIVLTVTMSYANVEFFDGDNPLQLKMYRMANVRSCLEAMTISANAGEGIVVGNTTALGKYTLAFAGENPPGQCPPEPGGGGGGLPRPGTGGLLLDSAAILGTVESEDNNDGGSDGGGGGNRLVVIRSEPNRMTYVETFPESYFTENPLDRIEVNDAEILDADGNSIIQSSLGQQIGIAGIFTNHQKESQQYSFIALIINEDGMAVDIDWQEGTVEPGQTAALSIFWMPQEEGDYTVKIFIWDGFENPLPLSKSLTRSIYVG